MRRVAERITVYEVGPRDGLQNEARFVATEDKLRLLRLLADAGLSRIEATSFVSPTWIPGLADAAEVVSQLRAKPGLAYVVLVPNAKGLARLLDVAGNCPVHRTLTKSVRICTLLGTEGQELQQ